MPTWKKVIVSGSQAHLQGITASQVPEGSNENVLVISTTGEIKQVSQANVTGQNLNSFKTISVGGLGTGTGGSVEADSSTDTLIISSSDANLIISASGTTLDTITFDFADSPSFTNITASGDLAVNGGDITTTSTNFNLLAGASSTISIGAAATTTTLPGSLTVNGNTTLGDANGDSVTIGAQTVTLQNPLSSTANVGNILVLTSSNRIATQSIDTRVFGTSLVDAINGVDNRIATFTNANSLNGETNLTFDGTTFAVSTGFTATTTGVVNASSLTTTGNVVVGGDLTVNGTTTILNVENVLVKDKFILLASGSISGSASHTDGGIIVQYTTGSGGSPTGSALFLNSKVEVSNPPGNQTYSARWGLNNSVGHTQTTINPTDYLVSVTRSGAVPTAAPEFGGQLLGFGNMYVQNNGDIWFWTPDLTDNEGNIVYAGG